MTFDRKLSKLLSEILLQDLEDRLAIKEIEFHMGLQIKGHGILGLTYLLKDLSRMEYYGDDRLR